MDFTKVNLLIGANGVGKSNVISLFQMLNFALEADSGLQQYVALRGASRLLHFGPKQTKQISAALEFDTKDGENTYDFTLAYADEDSLIYTSEGVGFHRRGYSGLPKRWPLGVGHSGSKLAPLATLNRNQPQAITTRLVQTFLKGCRVYHFHDTSSEGPLRRRWDLDGGTNYLRANGENLPAYLLHLRETVPDAYLRIRSTIQLVVPMFDDFVLEPEGRMILLRFRMISHPDYPIAVNQISDGTLRLIALVTLLRQPAEKRPQMIVLDEPELGLHPAAEATVASLIRAAADEGTQVLVATQSATFLSHFDPEQVIVAENEGGATTFQRHTREELSGWLERYSLGQIWLKNLIGGRP